MKCESMFENVMHYLFKSARARSSRAIASLRWIAHEPQIARFGRCSAALSSESERRVHRGKLMSIGNDQWNL
jgi:hypothetical protein